jgi:glc operon protein GlcG
MQQLKTLGDEDARAAIEAIRLEVLRRQRSAVIAVADAYGETIALLRMNGAAFSSVDVSMNKAFTAARLRRPTRLIGRNVRDPETGFDIAYYGNPRFVGFAGGLPVIVDGVTRGAVAVSGLTQDEDEDLARLGIAAIMAAPPL